MNPKIEDEDGIRLTLLGKCLGKGEEINKQLLLCAYMFCFELFQLILLKHIGRKLKAWSLNRIITS